MNLINHIWDFFASVKLAIFTLSTLAITSIIGTIIPQGEPPGFYTQSYGAKTAQFMQILDIPEMYSSWWFLGLLGLLSANLIICSVERLPRVWKLIHGDNLSIDPGRLLKMSQSRQWQATGTELARELPSLLGENGWKTESRKLASGTLFFSQKGKWSRLGVYIVHLSILVIFVGAIWGHFAGFTGSAMIPELTSTRKIISFADQTPIDLGFEIRCNRFIIEFYDNGMPKEYQSSLTVLENGKEVLTRDIEVNDPLTYKGITFYQSSYRDYKDFIFHITEKSSGEIQQFPIQFQQQLGWKEKNIRFGIVNAEAIGNRVTRIKVWFKNDNSPAVIKWMPENGSITVPGTEGEFIISAKQMYATGLQVAKDPGIWVVYLGCTLMMVGLFMAFFLSHKRLWLLVEDGGDERTICLAGNSNKNRPTFIKQFKEVEHILNTKLGG